MTEPSGENATPLPAPGRFRLRPLAFGAVLLISGAVIGSALTMLVLRSQAERARNDPTWLSQRAATHLVRSLGLTSEQSEQVHKIFQAHHERVRAFREEHGSSAREIFADLQAEIEEVLTPEQSEKWRQRIRRARERAMRDGAWGDRGEPRMQGPRDRGPRSDTVYRHDRGERPDGMRPNGRFPRHEGMRPSEGAPLETQPLSPGATPPPENRPPSNV